MPRARALGKRPLLFRVLISHPAAQILEKADAVKRVNEKIAEKVLGRDPKPEPDARQIRVVPEA